MAERNNEARESTARNASGSCGSYVEGNGTLVLPEGVDTVDDRETYARFLPVDLPCDSGKTDAIG